MIVASGGAAPRLADELTASGTVVVVLDSQSDTMRRALGSSRQVEAVELGDRRRSTRTWWCWLPGGRSTPVWSPAMGAEIRNEGGRPSAVGRPDVASVVGSLGGDGELDEVVAHAQIVGRQAAAGGGPCRSRCSTRPCRSRPADCATGPNAGARCPSPGLCARRRSHRPRGGSHLARSSTDPNRRCSVASCCSLRVRPALTPAPRRSWPTSPVGGPRCESRRLDLSDGGRGDTLPGRPSSWLAGVSAPPAVAPVGTRR